MTARVAALNPSTEAMRLRAELTGARRVVAAQRKQIKAHAEALALLDMALVDVDGVARAFEDHAPAYSVVLHVAAEDMRMALGLLRGEGE